MSTEPPSQHATTAPFAELGAYVDLPRLTGLALHPAGEVLVATVQQPDEKRARYLSSLWELPLDGGAPARLTSSDQGETDPAFRPDGTLLFCSRRPRPAPGRDADSGRRGRRRGVGACRSGARPRSWPGVPAGSAGRWWRPPPERCC